MRAHHALALLFAAACTPRPTPAADAADSAVVAAVPSSMPGPDAAVATPDASPPIELAADGGLAALLSGTASAARLPEVATDPGAKLDRDRREDLTTVEVVAEAGSSPNPASLHVAVKDLAMTRPIPDADRVVASTRGRARLCYANGLPGDPAMSGKLVLLVQVGAKGDVDDAVVGSNSGLSDQVARCVARQYKNSTFAAPDGGASRLTITLTFDSAP